MSDFRPQPERRRLTMSHCDAVTAAGGRSTSTTADEVMTELKTLGLHDIVVRHCAPAGRCVLLKSCTDDDLKSRGSFKKKDERIVAAVKTADDRVIASVGKDDEMKKFVQQQNIGWNCRKGLKAESPNQDTFSVIVVEGVFALYCVYDGHGPNGHDVSDLVADKLMALFLKSKDRLTDPGAAFTTAFLQCQEQVAKTVTPNPAMSGTTCTMAYHDYKTGKITIAHVGDSRAVLGKRRKSDQKVEVEELTIDHKPNLPDERRRIESSNPPGRVVFDGFYNHRVFSQKGMYPGLNMSRAIGDVVGHEEAGLTAQPDIKEINLEEMKKDFSSIVLILCTDGVWEFIDSQCAVDMVYSYNSKSKCDEAIEHLAKESYDCWMKDSDNEISDDITGLLVHLI
mmetsp:Transcript_79230/g.224285  ORF Transcript_79230/g.224285 Transcript_79230/m.224285 type:complete len:396 (-) Transcript_79230:115-1302(-)